MTIARRTLVATSFALLATAFCMADVAPPKISVTPKGSPPVYTTDWKLEDGRALCIDGMTPASKFSLDEWRGWSGHMTIKGKDNMGTEITCLALDMHIQAGSATHHVRIASNSDGSTSWWLDGSIYAPTCTGTDPSANTCTLDSAFCGTWVEAIVPTVSWTVAPY